MSPALAVDDGVVHYHVDGAGDRLLILLHGWPQTRRCWDRVTPLLADDFTVATPDLRGYGRSRCTGPDFSKRAAARDLSRLVDHLGFSEVDVVGHDRGARVAHRWALDEPTLVRRLALLDVLPTREVIHGLDEQSAIFLWHWLFHQQRGLAERLIGANVEAYLRYFFEHQSLDPAAIPAESVAAYVEAYSDPWVLHSTLEDYRASFSTDLDLDDRDHVAGRRIDQPVLLLWGEQGGLAKASPVEVWQRYAADVRGHPVSKCKHFLPEEQPHAVATQLLGFLTPR